MHKVRWLLIGLILLVSLSNLWLSASPQLDWRTPLRVVIYPINADRQWDTGQYIAALDDEHFEDIEHFLARQGERYRLPVTRPVRVRLAGEVQDQPPELMLDANRLEAALWGLRMRVWAWRHDDWPEGTPDIRIFMRFHSHHNDQLPPHSMGLRDGRIGLVNGIASIDYQPRNNFIAAHELLHTLGASDKYDLSTNLPAFPQGYAEPARQPRLPQQRAEIMAGRIPVTEGIALMPRSLDEAVIGPQTAREIAWQ
ncbi:hypothetical protein K6T12_14290 [Marinobacterium sp. CAU 1594]|nr:hypothetical protein [Marinobacterium arenosum]